MQFLFQHIERCCLLCTLYFVTLYLRLGLRQGPFIHFLVRVEGYSVYLHRHSRHHIGRFAVSDEGIEFVDVDSLVANDVGSDELTAVGVVEGLHGSILNASELADDRFDFFEFDTEAADLDLSVASAHKLDIAVLAVVHDVAGLIAS